MLGGLLKTKISVCMEKYCCFFMLYNLLAFNSVFFAEIYDKSQSRPMVCGAFAVIWMLGVLGCLLLFNRYTVKILSCMFLLINAGAFYFIKTYHVAIEEEMLNNVWQTNTMESLNATWLLYVLFLGALPCFFINRLVIKDTHFVKVRLKWLILAIIIPIMIIAPFSRDVFPFVREHRKIKYFLLPVNYISAVISTVKHKVRQNRKFQVIGENAAFQPYWKNEKKMLIVFVVRWLIIRKLIPAEHLPRFRFRVCLPKIRVKILRPAVRNIRRMFWMFLLKASIKFYGSKITVIVKLSACASLTNSRVQIESERATMKFWYRALNATCNS